MLEWQPRFHKQKDKTSAVLSTWFFVLCSLQAKEAGLSYPADNPVKRIDYILFRPNEGVKVKRTWIVSSLASDHVPVVGDFEVSD